MHLIRRHHHAITCAVGTGLETSSNLFEPLESRLLMSVNPLAGDVNLDQFIVRFDSELKVKSYMPGTHIGKQLGFGFYEVQIDSAIDLSTAVNHYNSLSDVAYAQPDYVLGHVARTPNDIRYQSLWGMNNTGQTGGTGDADIDAAEAWSVRTDAGSIIVAVIDTGIDYRHEDLTENIWINNSEAGGQVGVDDDGNGYIDDLYGYDFYNEDGDPLDDNGHGTHVSGTIGAVGDNGHGVAGIAWDVQLMGLKFLDADGGGYTSDAVRAVNYARQMGAKVINASFGGGGYSRAMNDAIRAFGDEDGIFVAAAGNEGINNDANPSYPVDYDLPNIIAVGASDSNDRLARWSNYGVNSIDIVAPGVSILSTLPNDRYGTYSGTSMATPHVAGAAALIWAAHSDWSHSEVISAIYENADPVLLDSVTHGRLNLNSAIRVDQPVSQGPQITSAQWIATDNSVDGVTLTFNKPIDMTTVTLDDTHLIAPDCTTIPIESLHPVEGSNGTQVKVRFGSQMALGIYEITIGPGIEDLDGNLMDQDQDGIFGETPDDQFNTFVDNTAQVEFSWEGERHLKDRRATTINIPVYSDLVIDDIDVHVKLEHTWISDLQMTLISPNGTRVRLFNRHGGSGDDMNARFNDEAATRIQEGAAPFSGEFKPQQKLSKLDGDPTKGMWKLRIRDRARGDSGNILGAKLIINPEGLPDESQSPSLGIAGLASQWLDTIGRIRGETPDGLLGIRPQARTRTAILQASSHSAATRNINVTAVSSWESLRPRRNGHVGFATEGQDPTSQVPWANTAQIIDVLGDLGTGQN